MSYERKDDVSFWSEPITEARIQTEEFQTRLLVLIQASVRRLNIPANEIDDVARDLFVKALKHPEKMISYTPAEFTRYLAWWVLTEFDKLKDKETVSLDQALVHSRSSLKTRAVEKAVRVLSSTEDNGLVEQDRLIWKLTFEGYSARQISAELHKDGFKVSEKNVPTYGPMSETNTLDSNAEVRARRVDDFITGALSSQEEEQLWADAFDDPELFADLVEARPIEQLRLEEETVRSVAAQAERDRRREVSDALAAAQHAVTEMTQEQKATAQFADLLNEQKEILRPRPLSILNPAEAGLSISKENLMRQIITPLLVLTLMAAPSVAANEATACHGLQSDLSKAIQTLADRMQVRVDDLSADLKTRVDEIQDDMPDSDGIDGYVGIDFDVEWKLQTIKLHLPEVVMKEQKWIYDLPSVTVRDKKMIFHTPATRMKPKKVGQYPEFHGPFKVKWKDIITHVPETYMQRQEIIMGVPEFRMEEQRTILHVPEFSMRLNEIKLHLPEFTVKDIKVESGKAKAKAEDAEKDFQTALSREQALLLRDARQEITPKVSALFSCYRTEIENKRNTAMAAFLPAIEQLKGAIANLRNSGGSEHVPELERQLQDLLKNKVETERRFDESLKSLLEQERETIEQLLAGFAQNS
ncbi:hypothetical protein AC249_AIPGENE13630 [Exaiptasia diaphana]|nr:hypothetical protein AC249_AIPGENE13630 [Exaiptasia diaphana]